jgi:uncharacterized protein (UPF0335 family)
MSRIVQSNVAVHHAPRVIRQSGDATRRALVMQAMQRRHVSRLVQVVAATPATVEDLNQLAEIAEDAQHQGLDVEQVEQKLRESTPFAGLIQLLPKDREARMELYAVLQVLLTALTLIVAMRVAQQTQVVTPEQVEDIIERVVDHMERQAASEAPPTTAKTPPHCD